MKWMIIVMILLALCGVSSANAYYFYNRYDSEDTETQEAMSFAVFVTMTIGAILLGISCAVFFIAALIDVFGG